MTYRTRITARLLLVLPCALLVSSGSALAQSPEPTAKPRSVQAAPPESSGSSSDQATTDAAGDGASGEAEPSISDEADRACREAPMCKKKGQCVARDGACVAANHQDCRASLRCASRGRCVAHEGSCVATEPADCQASASCGAKGLCSLVVGECALSSDPGHRGRRATGPCSLIAGECLVRSDADCRASEECKRHGRCSASQGECVALRVRATTTSWPSSSPSEAWKPERSAGERRSTGAMIAGIVMLSVGAVEAIGTGVTLHFALKEQDKCKRTRGCGNQDEVADAVTYRGIGVGLGSAIALAGIGLIMYGAPRVSGGVRAVELELGPTFTGTRVRF